MLSYVIVAAKPGCEVPANVTELLQSPDLDDLLFVPRNHTSWTSEGGRLAFAGWQAYPEAMGIRSHWAASEFRVTAFAGLVWPREGRWAEHPSWAGQLVARFPTPTALQEGARDLRGVFSLTSLLCDGTGVVLTDPMSIQPLYWAETDDVVIVASHDRLAARIAAGDRGRRLPRDPEVGGWLVYLSHVVGDRSGFAGVKALPLGWQVEFDPRWGARANPRNAHPWIAEHPLPADEDELFDAVHQDLLASVRSVAALPASRRLADVTGGRDSRLIVALMAEAGVTDEFHFRTIGAPDAPDRIVGTQIAEALGLTHEVIEPFGLADTDFERRLGVHSFQLSGTFNAWDLKGSTGAARSFFIASGGLAELMKSPFPELPWPCSRAQLLDRLVADHNADALRLLHPEVRDRFRAELIATVADAIDGPGATSQDRLDAFLARHRLRRRVALENSIGNSGRVFPLYSLLGIQAAYQIGPQRRGWDTVHFEVMRRSSPLLTRMPFAGKGWAPGLVAGRPDAAELLAEPVKAAPQSRPEWQASRIEVNREVFEQYLLDDPRNPVFDLIDRHAVEQALHGGVPLTLQGQMQLFGALSAAVWMGEHELPARIGGPELSLPAWQPYEPPVAPVAPSPLPVEPGDVSPPPASDEQVDDPAPEGGVPASPTTRHRSWVERTARRAARPIRRTVRRWRSRGAPKVP